MYLPPRFNINKLSSMIRIPSKSQHESKPKLWIRWCEELYLFSFISRAGNEEFAFAKANKILKYIRTEGKNIRRHISSEIIVTVEKTNNLQNFLMGTTLRTKFFADIPRKGDTNLIVATYVNEAVDFIQMQNLTLGDSTPVLTLPSVLLLSTKL